MQSVTTDHFCSNDGTRKMQPTVTPNNLSPWSSRLSCQILTLFFLTTKCHSLSAQNRENLPNMVLCCLTFYRGILFCHICYLFCKSRTYTKICIFRLKHSILFPYYPPNLNIPKIFQIICSRGHMKGHVFSHIHNDTHIISVFDYKLISGSMQEHYGSLQAFR